MRTYVHYTHTKTHKLKVLFLPTKTHKLVVRFLRNTNTKQDLDIMHVVVCYHLQNVGRIISRHSGRQHYIDVAGVLRMNHANETYTYNTCLPSPQVASTCFYVPRTLSEDSTSCM